MSKRTITQGIKQYLTKVDRNGVDHLDHKHSHKEKYHKSIDRDGVDQIDYQVVNVDS